MGAANHSEPEKLARAHCVFGLSAPSSLLSGVRVRRSNERLEPTVRHPFSIKNWIRWIDQRIDQIRHPWVSRDLLVCQITCLTRIKYHPSKHDGFIVRCGYEISERASSLQIQIVTDIFPVVECAMFLPNLCNRFNDTLLLV